MFIGVDGCKKGWIYRAVGPEKKYRIGFVSDIGGLWNKCGDAALPLIDIPVGLPFHGPRACEKACKLNQAVPGAKIIRQAWRIAPKIREADASSV